MTAPSQGLLDTSVFIALESGRFLNTESLPANTFVCVVTLAELNLGVLAAPDVETRSARIVTLGEAGAADPLPVDAEAARAWARLRMQLRETGRRAKINDLWIAAVAVANDLAVVTQDDDFDVIEAVGGPPVIRV